MNATQLSTTPESRATREIREIFQSGRPLTYVKSAEEHRVVALLDHVAGSILESGPIPVWKWSLTEGLHKAGRRAEEGTKSARTALDFILTHESAGIFHLKDFHEPLRESADVRRRLRDIYEAGARNKWVVISSPVRFIPDEIERSIVYMELRPPDVAELTTFLRGELPQADILTLQTIARNLVGLTLDEARYAVRRGLTEDRTLGPDAMRAMLEEKRLLVNRGGVIEYISDSRDLGEVGGLEVLKKWLMERRKLFQIRDTLSSEIVPKGVLFMGIPGCGKSLCVKAIASAFGLPLYRIDMIEMFSGRHGKPEGAFVAACKMMEEMSPAVLWFDEIEMAVTSTESSGEQGRIFAFFLTWMQEKTRGLFVAATANRIDLLPAEMIRKGRFDEVFFVDIPLEHEQLEIFKIHLTRRGIDTAKFKLHQLLQFTNGWTGAEIEQCVISAITKAKLDDRELTDQDLVGTAAKIVPLSRTMKEQISHIRGWAFERAVKASGNPPAR